MTKITNEHGVITSYIYYSGFTGCVIYTPTEMLPILSGILTPQILRQKSTLELALSAQRDEQHILHGYT